MNSTSAQVGFSSYSVNAPKVIRKVKEKTYGVSLYGIAVASGWIIVSIIVLVPLAFIDSVAYECFVVAFLLGWAKLYFKYANTDEKLEESYLFLKFLFDGYSGLHLITRYDTELTFLQDIFPLVNIHENGLIEFLHHEFGLIIKFVPPRVHDEDDETHTLRMQEVIDGLSGNTSLKFISTSKQMIRKPFLEKLLAMMNKKGINPKVYEYIYSIYEMIKNKKNQNLEWSYCAFFGLGKFDNIQDAIDQMDSELPGLEDALDDAGMKQIRKLTDALEITREYRQMAYPVVIE